MIRNLNGSAGQHLMSRSNQDILEIIKEMVPEWATTERSVYVLQVIEQLKVRSKSVLELVEQSGYFFTEPESYDKDARKKAWKENTPELLNSYLTDLAKLGDWNRNSLESSLRNIADIAGVGAGRLIHPVRLALSGVSNGPSLFIIMELLGKERCLQRIQTALNLL